MLRKILMTIGLFVAFLPYLGIPRVYDAVLYSTAGLAIFFLLVFTKRSKAIPVPQGERAPALMQTPITATTDRPEKTLPIARSSGEETHPRLEVEEATKETVIEESPEYETVVEEKVTVKRRRKNANGEVQKVSNKTNMSSE